MWMFPLVVKTSKRRPVFRSRYLPVGRRRIGASFQFVSITFQYEVPLVKVSTSSLWCAIGLNARTGTFVVQVDPAATTCGSIALNGRRGWTELYVPVGSNVLTCGAAFGGSSCCWSAAFATCPLNELPTTSTVSGVPACAAYGAISGGSAATTTLAPSAFCTTAAEALPFACTGS